MTGWSAEGSFRQIVGVVGSWIIAPKPAHHFRQDRASLFLTV
jgi:hypothetical protein